MNSRFVFLAAFPVLAACGSDDERPAPTPAPAGETPNLTAPTCAQAPAPVTRAGACAITEEAPPIAASADLHVPEGTAITYCTNPPSSGPHYPVWADFQEYEAPIEAPYLVHSLEHGAVILQYRCEGACPDVAAQLRAVRDAVPIDPLCFAPTRARIILVPNPALTTPVAASAWGATYHADCVDAPSLSAFIQAHYAKGPENLCAPGRSF